MRVLGVTAVLYPPMLTMVPTPSNGTAMTSVEKSMRPSYPSELRYEETGVQLARVGLLDDHLTERRGRAERTPTEGRRGTGVRT